MFPSRVFANIQINLPLASLHSVILFQLPGPHRRLLGLVPGPVQLILYVDEPVQDEEEEQAHSGDERVALLAEHRLLDFARRAHVDGAEYPQIVQRVQQRSHDEVEVNGIQNEEADGEVLDRLAFPQTGDEVGYDPTDVVRRHRQYQERHEGPLDEHEEGLSSRGGGKKTRTMGEPIDVKCVCK
jgi:hypothetical protein